MNRKLGWFALPMFTLPLGVSFVLAKSAPAAEVGYQASEQKPILVAQRYDDRENHERRLHHEGRRVWIPGHYKPGFLGIFRIWVSGHWEIRR